MVILWFLAGAAIEVLNTLTRRWSVDRLHNWASMGWIAGGLVFRLATTSVILMLGFRHRPSSGVAALMGYLVCRWVMIWRIHRQLSEAEDSAGLHL